MCICSSFFDVLFRNKMLLRLLRIRFKNYIRNVYRYKPYNSFILSRYMYIVILCKPRFVSTERRRWLLLLTDCPALVWHGNRQRSGLRVSPIRVYILFVGTKTHSSSIEHNINSVTRAFSRAQSYRFDISIRDIILSRVWYNRVIILSCTMWKDWVFYRAMIVKFR